MNCSFHSVFRLILDPSWAPPGHRHEGHAEFLLVEQGRLRTRHENITTEGGPGEVLFDPENFFHTRQGIGSTGNLIFSDVRIRINNPPPEFSQPQRVMDENGRLRCLSHWMLELHPATGERQRQTLDALSLAFAEEFHHLLVQGRQTPVHRALAFMKANLAAPLSLDEIAAQVGLSKFRFLKIFKQETGQTPMQTLRRLRVEAAEPHILQSHLTLDAIAQSVGLVDGSHLSRLFREITGESPGAFRRRSRQTAPQTNTA
jgi:AraC-like DNA-binding protein